MLANMYLYYSLGSEFLLLFFFEKFWNIFNDFSSSSISRVALVLVFRQIPQPGIVLEDFFFPSSVSCYAKTKRLWLLNLRAIDLRVGA